MTDGLSVRPRPADPPSISELSGDGGSHDVDGNTELLPWLEAHGDKWEPVPFIRAMQTLKHDGYVRMTTLGGMRGIIGIRLDTLGRHTVEGWPSAGSIDADALANAIVTALAAQADNPDTPEEAKGFLRKLGEGAVSTVVTTAVTAGMASAGLG